MTTKILNILVLIKIKINFKKSNTIPSNSIMDNLEDNNQGGV